MSNNTTNPSNSYSSFVCSMCNQQQQLTINSVNHQGDDDGINNNASTLLTMMPPSNDDDLLALLMMALNRNQNGMATFYELCSFLDGRCPSDMRNKRLWHIALHYTLATNADIFQRTPQDVLETPLPNDVWRLRRTAAAQPPTDTNGDRAA